MSSAETSSFDRALYTRARGIIDKTLALAETEPEDLSRAVGELLIQEAPEGMPMEWAMYLKEVAASFEEEGADPGRQTLLRRVGDAIVEAIDEGEVSPL
jgi:hypothetical protein